jgi:hypothetical protein
MDVCCACALRKVSPVTDHSAYRSVVCTVGHWRGWSWRRLRAWHRDYRFSPRAQHSTCGAGLFQGDASLLVSSPAPTHEQCYVGHKCDAWRQLDSRHRPIRTKCGSIGCRSIDCGSLHLQVRHVETETGRQRQSLMLFVQQEQRPLRRCLAGSILSPRTKGRKPRLLPAAGHSRRPNPQWR